MAVANSASSAAPLAAKSDTIPADAVISRRFESLSSPSLLGSELREFMMNWYFRLLRVLLALGGCTLASAAVPIFFSPDLMATLHGGLGLGEFPEQRIVIYLAKSTSMLYAIHGSVMLFIAVNFERYKHMVPFMGWLHVALGAGLLYIDVSSQMPWWWLLSEGPPVIGLGLLYVWLYRKAILKAAQNKI